MFERIPSAFARRLRLTILVLAVIFFMVIYVVPRHIVNLIEYPCYMGGDAEPSYEGLEQFEDVLQADVKPVPGRTIFFHETKCYRFGSQHVLNLTARQACAIESAALRNPNFQVYLLLASATYHASDQPNKLLDVITKYKNVHVRQLNLWHYAEDTPIEAFIKKGDLFGSDFLTEHTSDLLRLLTLYRFGGIYLDLDVVVTRSLENIPPNYVVAHDIATLGNAVISLQHMGKGHEIAKLFLEDYARHYNGKLYVVNGPHLITRVARGLCRTNNIQEMMDDSSRCQGLHIFGPESFFALSAGLWYKFFDSKYYEETMNKTKDSYLIHVWNKSSYKIRYKIGSGGAYEKYMEKNCPLTLAAAGEYI